MRLLPLVALLAFGCNGSSDANGADGGPDLSPENDLARQHDGPGVTPDSNPSDAAGKEDGDAPAKVPLEGYGTTSTFGAGGQTCTVTTLNNAGAGSLRQCVENRSTTGDNPTPVTVVFSVGGTINLTSDLWLRQPYLTIDGLSAPAPGITLAKSGNGQDGEVAINTWKGNQTCGHDVLVQGIRFKGVWTRDTDQHSQNAGTIGFDGEDLPLCLKNVALNRITVIDGQDAAGDIWGSAKNVTVQYSAFIYDYHPSTYSHSGNAVEQRRERISNHHNLYAYFHERGPQVRGDVQDLNYEQNIVHKWAAFGFGGGYAMRLRYLDSVHPLRVNLVQNHWTSGGVNLDSAIVIGDKAGPGDDGAVPPQVFMSQNRLPAQNVDKGTATQAFIRPPEAKVTLFPASQLTGKVLPRIGVPHRTAEEKTVFAEVAQQVTADLGP